ncbi:MAG: GTPase Era [Burkholderiaceae bacterium]
MSAVQPKAPARTGFVAIVGRPNVGKSTLLNALVGEHVSITSRKPQTTRHRVLGVLTQAADAQPTRQFIFVDTPGFQRKHRSLLTRRMNETVRAALAEVDAIVLVIDARGWTQEDEAVLELLPRDRGNVVLALNKTDELADRNTLLPLLAASARRFAFAALVPVSAEKGWQLEALVTEVGKLLPEGEPLFDAEQFTDRSVRFLAAERIREKAFRLLGDELPYGLTVTIDRWEENEGRAVIAATLVVDRESHKAIVIGARGAKLREIGRLARIDVESLVGKPVFLETHVRVRRGWSDDERVLKQFGYE